ncbi:MAG: caspase family protein [Alphaproteobacteria bacterium]|nr:caspase family protein [Alphaproteobacteria bacterium]
MGRMISFLLAGAMALGASLAQAQEKRVALIIGNDAYKSLPALNNAVADARAMDRKLKEVGFQTILRTNAGRTEMGRAISEFGGRIGAPDTVGLVFYSGHGIQAFERNWLIPVDAALESDVDLQTEALDAQRILSAMDEARNPLNIVILDACRDNPLPKKGRSASRGLSVVSVAPRGSVIAYSASPNQKADDGNPGGNGIYTAELLKALDEPGLKIEDVFKRANGGVQQATGGRQVPWFNASIQGDFFFRPGAPGAVATAPSSGGRNDTERKFWDSAEKADTAEAYEAYLKRYPSGTFADLARIQIAKHRPKTAAIAPSSAVRAWTAVQKDLIVKEVAVKALGNGDAYTIEASGVYPHEKKAPGTYIDYWTARWNGQAWAYTSVKGKISGNWAPGANFKVSFDIPREYLDDRKNSNIRLCLESERGCWPSPNLVADAN